MIPRRKLLVASALGALSGGVLFANRRTISRWPLFNGGAQIQLLDFTPELLDGYLFLGESSAPVKAALFIDYRCPTCESVLEQIPAVFAKHPKELCVYLRNFPVVASHPDAYEIAVLFEVARSRNLYREALILRKKAAFDFTPKMLEKYLLKTGPITATEKREAKRVVERDLALAKKLDLLITPSIVVCRGGEADLVGAYTDIERYL